jgi:hypothetical protein
MVGCEYLAIIQEGLIHKKESAEDHEGAYRTLFKLLMLLSRHEWLGEDGGKRTTVMVVAQCNRNLSNAAP